MSRIYLAALRDRMGAVPLLRRAPDDDDEEDDEKPAHNEDDDEEDSGDQPGDDRGDGYSE